MNKGKSDISVLIPDGDDHKLLVLQVINCLSLIKGIKIHVMSTNRHNHLRYSRYVKYVLCYPETNDKDWINNINSAVEKFAIDVILPVFEVGTKRLIENKFHIKEKNKLCALSSLSNFEKAINKGSLYQHLKKNGFPCPKSVIVKPKELPVINDLKFPVIAKPVTGYGGGQEISILKNSIEVQDFNTSNRLSCNIIFQNFIHGYDICCNVLCINGEIKAYSMQKANIFQNGEVTPQIGFSFVKELKLLEIMTNLMKSLDWSGVANIDCRYDENDNTFKIIEINPRFWINVDASAIANVNFPYLFCLSTLNISYKIQEANTIDYLNLKGLVKSIVKNPFLIFRVTYLRKNTPLIFPLKDPIPMIYKFIWRTKNIVVKKLLGK